MTILAELKDSEKVFLSITNMTTTNDSEWVTEINVEHSWHCSIADALDLYDIVESAITSEDTVKGLLEKHLKTGDYQINEGHIWLKKSFPVLEIYLNVMNNHVMDYLEYLDN